MILFITNRCYPICIYTINKLFFDLSVMISSIEMNSNLIYQKKICHFFYHNLKTHNKTLTLF